ncbi:hypothetical protein [Streptomyces sp. NPDC007355]|uniref:hypothetical protein n=1 Tax=Streptomyces sp. NPDC007355 TaxID=3364778 RepID=UPI0036C0F386
MQEHDGPPRQTCSTLLRRLGLLHTVAVPQVVTRHESRLGERWILELDHDAGTGLRRAELVHALTDPEHGLPLELRGLSAYWCSVPDSSSGIHLAAWLGRDGSPPTPLIRGRARVIG